MWRMTSERPDAQLNERRVTASLCWSRPAATPSDSFPAHGAPFGFTNRAVSLAMPCLMAHVIPVESLIDSTKKHSALPGRARNADDHQRPAGEAPAEVGVAGNQPHAVEPSVPVAAVIGLPVDHLTPPGGQYHCPAAVAVAAAVDAGRAGDSHLARSHGVGVVGGIQFGDFALAYLALRVETGPDQRLILTMPDGRPSTVRGQLTARLGIHHRYRRDMCGVGNEQHFDTAGGRRRRPKPRVAALPAGGGSQTVARQFRPSAAPLVGYRSGGCTVVPESTPAFPGGRLTKS